MGDEAGLRQRLAELFDLPRDIILDLPMISIVGNLNLEVENHRGIIKYNSNLIKIRVKRGQLIIQGRSLIVDQIREDKLMIAGKIDELSFELF